MVEIEFLGPIKFQNIKMQASNLGEVKEKLGECNELELNEWLKICAVAVNDDVVTSLDTPLKDGDKISILPPICGG
ncbi:MULTISPECIES: MoaD/ThiS family protein [Campylobacter]|uniref:MoaD/ThiS family protein n=1 Tax=Campylobacter TaxID=194 RepID=UPI00147474B2|nr:MULTISPECIES: MoaD/ThiS family protein [unclassified Campylobacter]MBE3021926.1 MoaD/ThiS family protein [Campylobacter sp. 7477a]MBE3609662.1 MoaD/ThiS family protein [Campylobacter sp. RM12916]